MRHYKLVVELSNGNWNNSKYFLPGTFNSAKEYLNHISKTVKRNLHLLDCPYYLLRFSEAAEEWIMVTFDSLSEILHSYNIDINLVSNTFEIET